MSNAFIFGLGPAVSNAWRSDTTALYESVGQNTGNLAFQHAVHQHLSRPAGVVGWGATPQQVHQMGEIAVIPGANQFGAHVDYARLAEKVAELECAIVMIGLGAQAKVDGSVPEVPEGTVQWVREIARRSPGGGPNISVRGPFTKEVLAHYGLGESAIVLGCPSLFINPDPLLGQRIKANIRPARRIAVAAGHQTWKALSRVEASLAAMVTATGGSYVGQHGLPMLQLTRGEASRMAEADLRACRDYACPHMDLDEFIRWSERHGAVFFDVPSWMEHYRRFDFVVGARIHGVMLALQAGVPGLCIVHDSRTLELCQTMKVPYVLAKDVKDGIAREQLLDLFDFDADAFDANRRFLARRYVEFLERNRIAPANWLRDLAGTEASIGQEILAS